MITTNNLRCKQGICYDGPGGVGRYGVVVAVNDGLVGIVSVHRCRSWTRCYDEGGATEDDKNNVKLRSCPLPFSDLCESGHGRKCFAYAKLGDMIWLNNKDLSRLNAELIDNGREILNSELDDIRDHLWRDTPQKEKRIDRGRMAEEQLGISNIKSDMGHGIDGLGL